MASETCEALMLSIKKSQLDFLIQETPFSSFVTIRKKFHKGYDRSCPKIPEDDNAHNETELDKLKRENALLKEAMVDKEAQFQAVRAESTKLNDKLEKTEKEMFRYCENTSTKHAKFSEEIATLKSQLKEKSDVIAVLKADEVKAVKTIKSLGKNAQNLENKNKNLEDKIEIQIASKNEIKNERDKLVSEVKNLRKYEKRQKSSTKSITTQTEAETSECILNNNPNPDLPTLSSKPTSTTASVIANKASQTSSSTSDKPCPDSETFDCVVCNRTFISMNLLKVHAETEHNLFLCPLKLLDSNEKDPFVRFVKSIEVEKEYIEKRRQLYPSHWDHIGERIKIRKLAQIKLAITSNQIQMNIDTNDIKSIKYSGWSKDTNVI